VVQTKERIPIASYSIVFTFGLAFESLEEFGVRHVSSTIENDI